MTPDRDGADVILYLEASADDGEVPCRRLYWLLTEAPERGWRARISPTRFASWVAQAVPTTFPGGDKRSWRLATRFAQVLRREEPFAYGVSPPVLGETRFERMES